MHLPLNESVDVIAKYYFNEKGKYIVAPIKIRWKHREYLVIKLGYQHKYRDGRVTVHIHEVVCQNDVWFRLKYNSESEHWTLEGVADGNPT